MFSQVFLDNLEARLVRLKGGKCVSSDLEVEAADTITKLRADLAAEQQNALNLLNAVGLLQSDLKQARAELAAAIHEKENRILERDEAESLLAKARAELAAANQQLKDAAYKFGTMLAARDELLKQARELRYQPNGKAADALFARIDALTKGGNDDA